MISITARHLATKVYVSQGPKMSEEVVKGVKSSPGFSIGSETLPQIFAI